VGKVGPPKEQNVAEALRDLKDEQAHLREKVELVMKEGGTLAKLADAVLGLRGEVAKTVPALEDLRRSVTPMGRIEKVVLLVGALFLAAIFTVVLFWFLAGQPKL